MAIAACFLTASFPTSNHPKIDLPRQFPSSSLRRLRLAIPPSYSPLPISFRFLRRDNLFPLLVPSAGGDGGINDNKSPSSGGGGGANNDNHDDGSSGDENAENRNREEALMALAEAKRSLESLPKDLAAAIRDGRIPGAVVSRFLELESSGLFRWLMEFGGFKERMLADDLFLAKVGMECGVGVFTKTAAEYERRRENFFKELEIVFADVVMAIIADFMLVYLPAPTVSLRPPLAVSAGAIAKFFHGCPDNAFQVALAGSSFSFLQRIGAIVRNGAKLFAVGTVSSLNTPIISEKYKPVISFTAPVSKGRALKLFEALSESKFTVTRIDCSECVLLDLARKDQNRGKEKAGTAVTNALINARKAVDKSSAGEVENVPILSTSVAYGVYMAISSNLRYQVLAGVIEQRILEPLLHQHKLMLSAICFAVRTGNTFLGSLLWVDYARLIGIQKAQEEHKALA